MLKKPVVIHLYDDEGKVTNEYKLYILPWRMVKRATAIFKQMGGKNENHEAEIDEMTSFLCEAFKNRFTPEDLAEHGDASEVMQAVNTLVESINSTVPNAAAETAAPQK